MSPATSATTFEVLAFRALPATGAVAVLELEGRFSAPVEQRLGRPVLLVEGDERVECAPVDATDAAAGPRGRPWRASFAVAVEVVDRAGYALAIGRDLLVELPAPDLDSADDLPRIARLARELNDARRALDAARERVTEAEDRARRAGEARRRVEDDLGQVRTERDEARAAATAADAAREEAERAAAAAREEADRDIVVAGQEAALKLEAVQAAHAAALESAQAEADRARAESEEALARAQAEREEAVVQARTEFEAELARVRADAETRLASATAAAQADREEAEADLDVARAGVAAARRDLEVARAELAALRGEGEGTHGAPATAAARTAASRAAEPEADQPAAAGSDAPPDQPATADSSPDEPTATGAIPAAAPASGEPTPGEPAADTADRSRFSLFRDPHRGSEDPTVSTSRRHDPSVAPTEAIQVEEGVRVLSRAPRRRHEVADEREPERLAPGATRIGARAMDRTVHRHRALEPQRIGALVALAIAVAAFVLVVVLRVGPI